jgi:hypothetical protein
VGGGGRLLFRDIRSSLFYAGNYLFAAGHWLIFFTLQIQTKNTKIQDCTWTIEQWDMVNADRVQLDHGDRGQ